MKFAENLQPTEYDIVPIAESTWITAMRNVIRVEKKVHGTIAKNVSAANTICAMFMGRNQEVTS